MLIPLIDLTDRVAFVDPAGGQAVVKRSRARSAIVVIAGDLLSRIFVLEAWADRCGTDRLIDRIFEAQARWLPRVFGCEANALQTLFAGALQREAALSGRRLPLLPVMQPTHTDKLFRIRAALQPVIADGRLLLPESAHELRAELVAFPMGATKDLVDALASAVALLPPVPIRRQQDDERAARLAYLRQTGAPAHYIEDVAAGRA